LTNGKENKKTNQDSDLEAKTDATIPQSPVLIKSAMISDGVCNYSYEIISGVGTGDTLNRKGSNAVHPDMEQAFKNLNVFLAIIDDAFHIKGIEIENPEAFNDHEVTELFSVTGFSVSGKNENEGLKLNGTKWVTVGGTMDCDTPKISISSGWKFRKELFEVVEVCKNEVEQYMNGKYAAVQLSLDMPEE